MWIFLPAKAPSLCHLFTFASCSVFSRLIFVQLIPVTDCICITNSSSITIGKRRRKTTTMTSWLDAAAGRRRDTWHDDRNVFIKLRASSPWRHMTYWRHASRRARAFQWLPVMSVVFYERRSTRTAVRRAAYARLPSFLLPLMDKPVEYVLLALPYL